METNLRHGIENLQEKKEITLSLREIINELCILTGIDASNVGIEIKTNVAYWGNYSKKSFIELMNSSNQYLSSSGNYKKNNFLEIKIFADKNLSSSNQAQLFCYELQRKLDLEEIQSDGKPLSDHCSVEVSYQNFQGVYATKLIIDKNIESLNVDLNLSKLINGNILESRLINQWYPANLIREAVINCLDKKNDNQNSNLPNYKEKVKVKKQSCQI